MAAHESYRLRQLPGLAAGGVRESFLALIRPRAFLLHGHK